MKSKLVLLLILPMLGSYPANAEYPKENPAPISENPAPTPPQKPLDLSKQLGTQHSVNQTLDKIRKARTENEEQVQRLLEVEIDLQRQADLWKNPACLYAKDAIALAQEELGKLNEQRTKTSNYCQQQGVNCQRWTAEFDGKQQRLTNAITIYQQDAQQSCADQAIQPN